MSKKAILVITDGIGYSPKTTYNAFHIAKTPTYDKLFEKSPNSLIETSGLSVGLPDGQMGNSEVGHMSIGSGRVLYQDLVKISLSLKDNSFSQNEVFRDVTSKSSRVHLVTLLSNGGVHSHIEHLIGVLELLQDMGKEVFIHVITDGRDVSPSSAIGFIDELKIHLGDKSSIASLAGRFYTMDRDNRWDRVQKGYEAIVNAEPLSDQSVKDYVENSYSKDESDEFIVPAAFNGYDGMKDNDSVIMLNFRSDRFREITTALGDESFSGFKRDFKKLNIATITEYDKSFNYPVLFKKEPPKNTLAEVLSKKALRQVHTAETEKYAHVTFFLNGGIDEPYENETRLLVPSPDVRTYDMKPQMSAVEVCDGVLKSMDESYDFIVVNFANGDMVGHTGNIDAAVEAVECVDAQLGRILQKAKDDDYAVLITSDHGNCEMMKDDAGNVLTNHTVGKVFCFVQAKGVSEVKDGGLNNIAPTILKLMDLEIPKEMDESLI